jgi:putative nucleotidyltransferase with HDIG domain
MSEVVGNPNFWREHVHEQDISHVLADRRSVFNGGIHAQKYRFAAKDGDYRWLQDECQLIRDEDGEPSQVVGCWIDITGQMGFESYLSIVAEGAKSLFGEDLVTFREVMSNHTPYVRAHMDNVARYSVLIARELGLSQGDVKKIKRAAELHDIGKIIIPAHVLRKPGKLTLTEMSLVQTHSEVGEKIVRRMGGGDAVCRIIRQHHERIDGSGYPDGVKGGDIHHGAKIVGVSDVVDAMLSERCYKPSITVEEVMEEIDKYAGQLYDSDVVRACRKLYERKKLCA